MRAISSSANGSLTRGSSLNKRTVLFDRSVDVPILDHAADQAQLGLNVMRIMRKSSDIGFVLHPWLAQLAITSSQKIVDLCLEISTKTGCRLKRNKGFLGFCENQKSLYNSVH